MTISYSDDFSRLLILWKGSVWKAIWKEAFIWLTLYYAIRLVILLFLDDYQMIKMKQVVEIFDSFTGRVPLQFLLGFYVVQVVIRWWAQIVATPWPDEVMVWTNTFFSKNDRVTRAKRRSIARYLILCETLALMNISTRIRKRFSTLQSLLQAQLITEDEYDLYECVSIENNRWQLPLQWIINGILVPSVNSNEIPITGAITIVSKVNDFRNALRLLYVYDWICIPLVYTQTCSVVVYGYFALCLIGHQYIDQEADLYFPFLTCLQFIFFVGWFKVAQDLMRPFGEDDDDMELNVVLDRHAAVAVSFADELGSLMPTFVWDIPKKDTADFAYIDSADDTENVETAFLLPYSKAALKSAKHDHTPKMHAAVEIKTPKDKELIETSTWIKMPIELNGAVVSAMETPKKAKTVRFTNPF